MKFRTIIFLLFCLPGIAQAYVGDPGCKDKNKEECRKSPKVHSIEQFVFMIPGPATNKDCNEHRAFRSAVVNFYRWYLHNENRITTGLSHENKGKDLMPPFNISWQTLHEYFEYIQKKYADWVACVNTGTAAVPSGAMYTVPQEETRGAIEDTHTDISTINFSNLAK